MPIDIVLLILRIAIVVALYAFLGAMFLMLVRDMNVANRSQRWSTHTPGTLTIVESGETKLEVGRRFELQRLTTLGRSPTCTITVPDSYASADHAHIVLRGEQWWLEDQHSHNGTVVNGMPVSETIVLASGDVIKIGSVSLLVELNN